MYNVTYENSCRICKSESLVDKLSLGSIYPSDFIAGICDYDRKFKQPITLCECLNCGLVQLRHTVELDSMYRQYWYKSSLNKSMIRDLQDVVRHIESLKELKNSDVVVDIGANDCTLFNQYSNNNLIKVGFDPALNLSKFSEGNCHYFINDYFSASSFPMDRKAAVVTAIAMFYDLPDPNVFVSDVVDILDDEGIFIIQLTDLKSMLEINAFDNICHEHLEYYRLLDIVNLLRVHGLEVFNVSYNKVNGGSLRVVAAKRDSKFINSASINHVANYIKAEKEFLESHSLTDLKKYIEDLKVKLIGLINKSGNTVMAMGASTKGNTLLQVLGINNSQINYVAEVNEDKFGLYTIGSNLCIISEDDAYRKNPSYFLLLPWHFIDNILEKHREFLDQGGSFIVPMPQLAIYNKNGRFIL